MVRTRSGGAGSGEVDAGRRGTSESASEEGCAGPQWGLVSADQFHQFHAPVLRCPHSFKTAETGDAIYTACGNMCDVMPTPHVGSGGHN